MNYSIYDRNRAHVLSGSLDFTRSSIESLTAKLHDNDGGTLTLQIEENVFLCLQYSEWLTASLHLGGTL